MTVSVLTISGGFRSVSGLCRVVYCTEWCTVQSGDCTECTVQSGDCTECTVQSGVLYRLHCTEWWPGQLRTVQSGD